MRIGFRRIVLLLSFALVISALAATGITAATPSGPKGKKVAFVGPIIAPVWTDAANAFKAKSKELGMKPSYTAPTTVDIPGNVQQLEQALAAGAQGLVTCALDPKAYGVALKDAKAKHVPVVLVDCDVPQKSMRVAFVGTIGKTFGSKTATQLLKISGGKAKVIIMQGTPDAAIQTQIRQGFVSTLTKSKSASVVATEYDNSDVPTAISKFEGLYQAHPEATAVYCIEANCPGAAAQVAKQMKRRITIVGIDDQGPTLAGIKDGSIAFSAAQPFSKMGRLAAQYLADSFSGKKVPSVTDTGVVFIDKTNLKTYKKG